MKPEDFKKNRLIQFLLVENDRNHAEIFHRTMADVKLPHNLHWVDNGEAAIQFVKRWPPYQDAPCPDVIFLDLKLPRISGIEVLQQVRSWKNSCHIPVVILSTSDSESDLELAYQNHANSFLVKPIEAKTFKELIGDVTRYWGKWNCLPLPKVSVQN